MNEETRDEDLGELREVASEVTDAMADARADAADLVNTLQDEVDGLRAALTTALERVAELEAAPAVAAAPAGDAELQGLAATYRNAVRNGHPDAPKHLEALLTALGAV